MYSARRPFNPRKLWDLLHNKFILLQHGDGEEGEDEDDEDDDNNEGGDKMDEDENEASDASDEENETVIDPDEALQNKRTHPAFSPSSDPKASSGSHPAPSNLASGHKPAPS